MFREPRPDYTQEEATEIARMLGINFENEKFDVEEFRLGINKELEHGLKYYETNITNDNPILTGKMALAHLKKIPDYYTKISKIEG